MVKKKAYQMPRSRKDILISSFGLERKPLPEAVSSKELLIRHLVGKEILNRSLYVEREWKSSLEAFTYKIKQYQKPSPRKEILPRSL